MNRTQNSDRKENPMHKKLSYMSDPAEKTMQFFFIIKL